MPTFANFSCFSTTKNVYQNDGVVVYVKEDLKVQCYEPDIEEANCLVSIINDNIAIISIYRSPSYQSVIKFMNSLDTLLKSHNKYKHLILTGDININIAQNCCEERSTMYLELAASHGLLPAHTTPTRENSCLDHVVMRSRNESKTLIINNSVTDHSTICLCLDMKQTFSYVASTSKINYQGIEHDLSNTNFELVLQETNCDKATNTFVNTVLQTIENNSSISFISKRKTPIKPWITPGMLRCMRNRDKMHKKLKSDPDNILLSTTYRRYRNICNNLLKRIKRQYERSQLENASRINSKRIWQVINDITRFKPHKTVQKEILSLSEDPEEAVNMANNYFAHVGENLAESIVTNCPSQLSAVESNKLHANNPNSFVLLETNLTEVISIVNSLKNTCSSGWDKISSKITKQNIKILAGAIIHICNLSINSGIFPSAFKQSIITPIYKSGPKQVTSNYRPISLLPTLSKILEKIINNQLITYMEKYQLLSPNQFGFRRGKSTTDAVEKLTDLIAESLDRKEKCLSIFLDLRKAFDTIPLQLLLKKLEFEIGVRGPQLRLLESYLLHRYQRIRVGDLLSDSLPVRYGIPQGSILGPTLFLVYNSLCNINLEDGDITSFADDTALTFKGRSWDQVFESSQNGFELVSRWLSLNLLSLNTDKTKYMTFSIVSSTQPSPGSYSIIAHSTACLFSPHICNCSHLNSVDKYLGVILDNQLNFSEHVNVLSGRVRKLIYIFKTMRHVANPSLIKTIYFVLCQSIITYCITVWGGADVTKLLNLERAQRAVLKISNFWPIRTPTTIVYEITKVLTVRQLFILNIILNQHKISRTHITNRHGRRKDRVFEIPKVRTMFAHRFHNFLGPFLYNKISKQHKSIHELTLHECKKSVTQYLQKLTHSQTEDLLDIIR